MNTSIKDLPERERPYEKCLAFGEKALSDGELLAVILRCGTKERNSLALANQILAVNEDSSYPGLLGLLHMSVPELMNIPGIGKVKAIQLKCIGELSRRMASSAARPGITCRNPESIASYYMEKLRHEEQELLYCMMLDTRKRMLGDVLISQGTVNATISSPREIFIEAVRRHAVGIVLVHNHPSGDPEPSTHDISLTAAVREAGEMLGILLVDHIIIGDQKYFSFCEQGLIIENAVPENIWD